MQKTLFFKSAHTKHFIEVRNDNSSATTYNIFFSNGNLNLFKIENYNASSYPSYDEAFTITVDGYNSVFLEITPKCDNYDIDASLDCNVYSVDEKIRDVYTLALQVRKEIYSKGLTKYIDLPKTFQSFEKQNQDTFHLASINPGITGNLKIKVNSNGELFLSAIENIGITDQKLFNRRIKRGSNLVHELYSLSKDLDRKTDLLYQNLSNNDYSNDTITEYNKQWLDDSYTAGAKLYPSKYFNEKISIFAPLYLHNRTPRWFIIFKKKDFLDIKSSDVFKDLEIVKTFDLRETTQLGSFIKNTKELSNFNKDHIYLDIDYNKAILETTGIDIRESVISTKYEDISSYIFDEERLISDFETYITDSYKRNSMISHKIFNFEFLFDDDSLDSMATYFGMYCDELDLETFNIKSNEYADVDLIRSLNGTSVSQTKLHTSSSKRVNNDYINSGKRIFYIKDPSDNFHFVNSIDNSNGYNIFDIDSFNLSNFICKSNSVIVDEKNVVDLKTFVNLDFTTNLNSGDIIEIIDGSEKWLIKLTDETDIVNLKISSYPKISRVSTITSIPDYLYQAKINGVYDIPDNHVVSVIDSSNNITNVNISTVTFDGDATIINFDDSVNVANLSYVDFSIQNNKIINVKLGTTLNQTLNSIVDSVNKSEIPFTLNTYSVDDVYTLGICYDNNKVFEIGINFSNTSSLLSNVKYFGESLSPKTYIVGGSTYISSYITIKSTYPVTIGEKVFKVDKNLIESVSKKDIISSGKITSLNSHNDILGNQILNNTGDSYLFRIPDKARPNENLELFDLCSSTFGLFSFYDIKDLDLNRLSVDDNYLTSEYSQVYSSPKEFESLQPGTFYRVKNNSTETPLEFNVLYSEDGSFNYEVVKTITINPGFESFFGTFATLYGKNTYKKKVEFRYTIISGELYNVTPYFFKEDGFVNSFNPTYSTNSLNLYGLKKLSDDLISKSDPNYVKLFRVRSEYQRLLENKPLNQDFKQFTHPPFIKWESYDSMDSKGDGFRLNFSPAFGKTGYTTTYSNFDSNTETHSHEWFILEQFPSTIKVYEKSQQIYGFSKIDRSLLLDITSNYFDEYFETGWPNIKRNGNNIPLNWKSNYSKIFKTGTTEYETMFKGVKYRFDSDNDLTGYKFTTIVSTKSGNSDVSSPFETHCSSETIDNTCNVSGILPELKDAIDVLVSEDNTLNLNVTLVRGGSPIHLDGNYIGTSIEPIFNNITTTEFKNEINSAINEWITLIQKIYSTDAGQESNITINYNLDEEIAPYPIVQNFITDEQKSTFGIGNVRIVVGLLPELTSVAETVFVSTSSFDSDFEYLTPTIIINASKFYRKDSQGSNTGAYSLKYLIAHEFGHVLGLGHTLKESSIMHQGIKTSYTFSERFPDGLYTYIDGECIKEVYGDTKGFFDVDDQSFSCDSNIPETKDSWEFLINQKYKTITLKIHVNMDTYLTLDSKKSFLDLYLSQDSKRIKYSDENGYIPLLEGADIRVPGIDLSLGGLEFLNEKTYADFISEYDDILDDDNLGVLPINSYFRIRNYSDNDKNYQISYGVLDSNQNFYVLNKSYDGNGNINRTLVGNIKDTSNVAIDLNIPFNTYNDFKKSTFWKIKGGESIDKWNSRLSLDYASRLIPNIKQTSVDNNGNFSSSRFFEVGVVSPKPININRTKYLENGENGIEVSNTNVKCNIVRPLVSFNPKVVPLITFGVRDDYDFSHDIGIDFFRCNTRFLYENPNFGYRRSLVKKVSDQKRIEIDNNTQLTSENSPLFERLYPVYKSPLDKDWYRVFTTNTLYDTISGFKDPYFRRNVIGSIIPKIIESHTFKVSSNQITFEKVNNNLEIVINLEDNIKEGLKDYYRDLYSQIYTGDDTNLESSLEKFIINIIRNSYTLSNVSYYEKQDSTTTYTTETTGFTVDKNVRSNRNGDNIILNKTIRTEVSFGVELTYKFI